MARTRIPAALAAVFLLAGACDAGSGDGDIFSGPTPPDREPASESLVIGLVGTMSGREAWRGTDAYEGADLAVHDLNVRRDEDAQPFELVTLDDKGDPNESVRLVEDLTRLESIVGVVFAGPPEALPRTERALAAAGIPALLVFGDLYGARALTEHVFQVSPSYVWEARRLASYAIRDRGYRTVGALVERSAAGTTALKSLRRALAQYRGAVLRPVRYAPGGKSIVRALRRLKRAHTEAVVVHPGAAGFGAVLDSLEGLGAGYRSAGAARIASASPAVARSRRRTGYWRPQVLAFDPAMNAASGPSIPAGTVVAESYGRGYHYLPLPSFTRFRRGFRAWWDEPALGWQARSYDAVRMIGWAADRAGGERDRAAVLETLRGKRFALTTITLGPDDHTAVDQATVGLWAVPSAGAATPEADQLPDGFEWVPLARGFSIDGEDLDIPSADWRYLVKRAPPPSAPPPSFRRFKFGITSGRNDPIH